MSAQVNSAGVSLRLDERRRQKLLSLKKREDMKQSMAAKLSSQQRHTNAVAKASPEQTVTKVIVADILERTEGVTSSAAEQPAGRAALSASPANLPASEKGSEDAYDWARIDEYAGYMATAEAERKRRHEHKEQQRLSSVLSAQISALESRRAKEKAEELAYSKIIEKESAEWSLYEQHVAEERKERAEKERRDRDDQMAAAAARRASEAAQRAEEERATLDRVAKELAEEKRRMLAKKSARKHIMAKIIEENEQEKAQKRAAENARLERDNELIHEYNALLAANQAKRDADNAARFNRQKNLMEKMQQTVQAQHAARSDEDNQRALQQAQEKEDRAREIDSVKSQKKQELLGNCLAVLEKQLEEKEEAKRRANEIKALHAKILAEDSQDFLIQQQRKDQLRKTQLANHRQALEDQIAQKRAIKEAEKTLKMNPQEKLINRELVAVVDRTLKERPPVLDITHDE